MILSSDNTLYTGITTDIRRRWRQHQGQIRGGAKYFRGRRPVSLAFLETGHDRSSASIREADIRRLTKSDKLELTLSETNQAMGYAAELPVLQATSGV
ncbi:MAG: GIY-YIG nuclease family protein [Endozoicomonas sp.]